MSPAGRHVCYPLEEDSELAEAIDADRRAAAVGALAARELAIAPGALPLAWAADRVAGDGGFGLLVLEGVLVHRVGVDDRYGAELLGEGDLLRPVPDEPDSSPLRLTASWQVLEPTRLAVLDERFVRQLAAFPRLAGRLLQRSVLRARQLAVNLAIIHQARVDVRLQMLLWHFAGRWGRVRADGVVVPLRLTHATLAELVGARRPTVSSAVSELARRDLVRSVDEGWLLRGAPPGELGVPHSEHPNGASGAHPDGANGAVT